MQSNSVCLSQPTVCMGCNSPAVRDG